MCRAEYGMQWDEFEGLTTAQWEALEERRVIRIRHARYDAALITSAIFNANRTSDAEPLSPFDFLPGFEEDPEVKAAARRRKEIIRGIRQAFVALPRTTPQAQVFALRDRMVARLKAQGCEDAELILREAFPNL